MLALANCTLDLIGYDTATAQKWNELTGGNTDVTNDTFNFEGFNAADQHQSLPIDYLPGHVGAVRSQVINSYEFDIEKYRQYPM